MCFDPNMYAGKTPEQTYQEYTQAATRGGSTELAARRAYVNAGQPRVYSSDPNAPVPGDPIKMPVQAETPTVAGVFSRAPVAQTATGRPSGMGDGSASYLFRTRAPSASVRNVG